MDLRAGRIGQDLFGLPVLLEGNNIRHDGAPNCQRPGLVEHDGVHPPGLFEVRSALDQDAAARPVADRGADRGRGRQSHRARARDQQHGHRAPDVAGQQQGRRGHDE